MNHSVKRRRQALNQTHRHYYLNISVEAANLSDWRIESNRIETFFARIGPVLASRRNAPLIRFLISALYISFLCLYRMLPHLSFFVHFPSLFSSLTYLFF